MARLSSEARCYCKGPEEVYDVLLPSLINQISPLGQIAPKSDEYPFNGCIDVGSNNIILLT
jgi:hypothetical protein